MTNQRLTKRRQARKQREQTEIDRLRVEITRLKKMVAVQSRKSGHGCSDALCLSCDAERPDDGTWEFP